MKEYTAARETLLTRPANAVKAGLVSSGAKAEFKSRIMDSSELSALRIAAATPRVIPADVRANSSAILALIDEAVSKEIDLIVFSEMALTGSSCADLFFQEAMRHAVLKGLADILKASEKQEILISLSLPLPLGDDLIKAGAYIYRGEILGITVAENLSSEEKRWFKGPEDIPNLYDRPFEIMLPHPDPGPAEETYDPLHQGISGSKYCSFRFIHSLEQIPGFSLLAGFFPPAEADVRADRADLSRPGRTLQLQGQNLYMNENAAISLIAISESRPEFALHYRHIRSELTEFSAKAAAVIIYAASGPEESTARHVHAGHRLICANGSILAEGKAYTNGLTIVTIDPEDFYRGQKQLTLDKAIPEVSADPPEPAVKTERILPFLPEDLDDWSDFCEEVLEIQARGLAGRLKLLGSRPILGLSGGVDSTLALLVCLRACRLLERPASNVLCVSMPGPGSSPRSIEIAADLAKATGSDFLEISVTEAVYQHLQAIGHDGSPDLTFENAQARERTQILMDLSNMKEGIVVGTGDLSELALGFCTYNADQMSMYSVNHSLPKTLARIILEKVATDLLTADFSQENSYTYLPTEDMDQKLLARLILELLSRPVSPELLAPDADGKILQKTEEIIGSYEHNDFFLYHMIFLGRHPQRVFQLACETFAKEKPSDLKTALERFIRRFVQNQFKRQAMPEGVQAIPYSLSPHASYIMAGDMSASCLIWSLGEK